MAKRIEKEKIVKHGGVTEQVYDILKGRIASGELKPGDKLPSENELANTLSISRMSARMAIQRLIALGLAESKSGDGTIVKKFTMNPYFEALFSMNLLEDNHGQINELIAGLELASIFLYLNKASDARLRTDMAGLEEILANMMAALDKKDFTSLHHLDDTFHFFIVSCADNELISKMYETFMTHITTTLHSNIRKSIQIYGGDVRIRTHHTNLVLAMKERDYDKVRQVMTTYLNSIRGIYSGKRAD